MIEGHQDRGTEKQRNRETEGERDNELARLKDRGRETESESNV